MTERPIERVQVAIGHELDALAVHYGVPFRKTGESAATLRQRIQATFQTQDRCPTCGADVDTVFAHVDGCPSEGPSDADLSAVVSEAIESWKTARQLPYLSTLACKQLNDLIVAGLRPVLAAREDRARQAGWDACLDLSSED